ncbi:hypothetical protein [Haladaptatus sp. DJG-WS-42]|uniref:hypothetical protein n=1 Tax=Haladaptatus sp. DJG-WS-42 TaxID=3120516 RepID=UPI0030D1CA11
MSSTQQQKSYEDVRDKVVQVLDQQTIRRVRQECQKLINENDLPTFEAFVENESDFILTPRRQEILNSIHNRLQTTETPGVFLHGAYGSGKTVLMKCVADLCLGPTEIGGVEFPQLTYGETEIDCFQISLQDNNTPNELLLAIYESVLKSEKLTERVLLDRFDDEKSTLSLDRYDNLPPKLSDELKQLFDEPESIDDISRACKSLSASGAHHTVTWFAEEYYEAEGKYPAFYIDEFEQTFRGIGPNEKSDLKGLIREMMRSTVDSHANLEAPPYILFINSVGLEELEDSIQAPEDTVDRIRGSVNYSINLAQGETMHLFSELYHLYTYPLLTDYRDEVPEWHETLDNAESGDEDYAYPFTTDALEIVLSVVDSQKAGDGDNRVVLSFRAFKTILMAFLREWDGESRIDGEYLYKHGDSVRNRLGKIKRAELSQLPGERTIQEQIEEDYSDSRSLQRILTAIAREAILNRNDQPALFSPAQVEQLAKDAEIELTTSVKELTRQAASQSEYIDRDGEYLVLYQNILTGNATTDPTKPTSKLVEDTIENFEADIKSTLDLWKDALETQLEGGSEIISRSNYLEIDVLGDTQYTEKVYLSVGTSGPPEEWEAIKQSDALKFGIHLGPSEDDKRPAEFVVRELHNRASNISDDIQDDLNRQIDEHIDSENSTSTLLAYINDIYPGEDEFKRYRVFLNISLLDILGREIPDEVGALTSPERMFSVLRYVTRNAKGQYGNGEYVTELLGFSNGHIGGDVLDFVYATKNLQEKGKLLYEGIDFDIQKTMNNIPNVDRGKKSGDELRQMFSEFESEQFLKKDGDSYEVTDEFSEGTRKVINKLEEELKEAENDELSFSEIVKTVFGTSKVAPVAKAYLYLILAVVSLHGAPFVLGGDTDDKIILPDSKVTVVRESVKSSYHDAIKREALLQGRVDNEGLTKLESLKQQYGELDDIDDVADLKRLEKDLETDFTTDSDNLKQRIRTIQSYDVYAETDVSDYISAVRDFNEFEAGLPFLIHDSLEHLVAQLEEAKDIVSQKDSVISGKETLDLLINGNVDIESGGIEISCIDSIGDHLASHDVNQSIVGADIESTIQRFIDDEINSSMVYEDLSRTRRQIVPNVEQYDSSEHQELLDRDSENLQSRFTSAVETEEEKIERAREQLKVYEPQIPEGEKALLDRGKRFLNQCSEMLDQSLGEFDAKQYNSLWGQWIDTEKKLAEASFDENDLEEIIHDLGGSVSPDKVMVAGTSLNDAVKDLNNKEEVRQLVRALDINSDTAEMMQAVLIRRWTQEGGDQ